MASLPGPCEGPDLLVANVNGGDPRGWTLDRWFHGDPLGDPSFLVLFYPPGHWSNLVRPLSLEERSRLVSHGRLSRPGPSGWKLAFLPLFPPWAQEAYWLLIDTQRACATVASPLRFAVQINMPKPAGGFRPLSMLEESFKAVEGPVARRMVASRLPPGAP